jgi:serine/threonine-protein kinase RsbW
MGSADSRISVSEWEGHMVIRPEPFGLRAARQQVTRVARRLRMDADDSLALLIAVGEALSNAYIHGTSEPDRNLIYLGWRFADDKLTVTVKDEGAGFKPYEPPSRLTPVNTLQGLGMRLMRDHVDNVRFEFDDGLQAVLTKKISLRLLR